MTKEILFTIDSGENKITSKKGLLNLLRTNDSISIINNKFNYNSFEYPFTLQVNQINKTGIYCYHLKMECPVDGDFSFDDEGVINFIDLYRDIRQIITRVQKEYEIIWDDLSFVCSQRAYPMIYEIENLMRKSLRKVSWFERK